MAQQVPVPEQAELIGDSEGVTPVAEHVHYRRLAIVNVMYAGSASGDGSPWNLVDAGIMGTARVIVRDAERLFGEGARPEAIVLTHGHFDHIGVLKELAEKWDVPIFAHPLEHAYLNGSESYSPPDPTVGGGLMSTLSRFFPRGPIDVSRWLHELPPGGEIPAMPGWQWIHTPGHTRGHISLWRESDRTLIAGDAFITTAQESAYAVLTQETELHGPPMYYTTNWERAGASVALLAGLEPEVVVTGHGRPLSGPAMREALHVLARDFDSVAIPSEGRYADRPGTPK